MNRPWIGRAIVGGAILVVVLGVGIRLASRSTAGNARSDQRAGRGASLALKDSRPDLRDGKPDPVAEMLRLEDTSGEHMTADEALGLKWPHQYPPPTFEVVLTPTDKLREIFVQLDGPSRATFAAAVEELRSSWSGDSQGAELQPAVDRLAELLAQRKGVEAALVELFRAHGVRGKQAFDRFFGARLGKYQGAIAEYQRQGNPQKAQEYVLRVEMLLLWQVELDKSVKYRKPPL